MATAKHDTFNSRQPRRRVLRVLGVLILIAVLLLAWFWKPLNAWAGAGASYGARIGCSCRFVAGRDLDSCGSDLEPGMSLVFLSEDLEEKSITARVPLLSSQTATWNAESGCVLDPWDE